MASLEQKSAFVGESLAATFVDSDAVSVVVTLTDGAKTATSNATQSAGGAWVATFAAATLAGIVGNSRWLAMATDNDGETYALGSGSIYIRPIVSRFRAVVSACEDALANYANNPNRQISVGEISITYKDRAELISLISYWRGRSEADERGSSFVSGPYTIRGGF